MPDTKKMVWAIAAIIVGIGLIVFWATRILPDGYSIFSLLWVIGGGVGVIYGIKELIDSRK